VVRPHILEDGRIVRNLHLVDGDAVGSDDIVLRTHSFQFSVVSPIIPAIKSILIWGNPMERAKSYERSMSSAPMSATVDFQDVVIEVLDT